MPLALAIAAILLVLTAIKGNYAAVGAQFNSTFFGSSTTSTGPNGTSTTTATQGFLLWFGSILGIAVIFRIIQAPKAGELFIALLILVYFLQNNGILSNIEAAIQGTAAAAAGSSASSSAGTATGSAPPASGAATAGASATASATVDLGAGG